MCECVSGGSGGVESVETGREGGPRKARLVVQVAAASEARL